MKRRNQPELGQTVKATITDVTAPSGERQVRGKVVELLSVQFVIEGLSRHFVFNSDHWVVDEGF